MTDHQPTSRRAAREQAAAPRRAAAEPGGQNTPAGPGGLRATIAKHPLAWLLGALGVVFVLLGTGAVFAGVAVASAPVTAPTTRATTPPPRPTQSAMPTASRLRTCSIAGPASDPRLMTLTGSVLRADTGEVLWDHGASVGVPTASTLKLLIASAAVAVLQPDFQIATDVVDGSTAGTVVLVGHGDPTLSALPAGQESVYPGAPKLSDLASQVVTAYAARHPGVPISQVVLDASYWNPADNWDPSVKQSERTQGYQSLTTALQVDGDRADPTAETSARSTDPVGRAGAAFIDALKNADPGGVVASSVATSTGSAVSGAADLGEVKSQPVRTLISQMLLPSDNTLGEMLARIVSKASGFDGTYASLQQAIPGALNSGFKIPAAGLTIVDGSGESANNKVPPATMTSLLRLIQAGSLNLDVVRAAMPVAGKSGSLASRFTGANAVVRGNVTAKTGWIDTEYSLAGFVTAADGTVLVFTFDAIGPGIKSSAKSALDTLTVAAYTCGDNLSNN
ncbi:MAG TPA: D-alanyl-D-alanine carboxypeptidase [Pseudolysinimonas sp.]|nr:D-alanyl-D-alanine carboxypeptidase [Pseudolysinimonas sp.]